MTQRRARLKYNPRWTERSPTEAVQCEQGAVAAAAGIIAWGEGAQNNVKDVILYRTT
jgi:hypothetical protein